MNKIVPYIFILLINVAFGQDKRLEKIDSVVSSWYSNNEFNGNILIAEKGNIIFNKSYGKANEETGEILNENSQFELASVSKQFTATAIMILKERNQLSLDDPITKYFPELVNYNKVTIKNLLNHTGGIPSFEEILHKKLDKTIIQTNKDVVNCLINSKPLFNANSQFEYSNTGYVLLGQIVEKISGITLNEYLQQNIFEKLGMNRTKIVQRRYKPEPLTNYAYGYVKDLEIDKLVLPDNYETTKQVIYFDGIYGESSLNSTVLDLYKWDRALYTEEILSKKSIEEMFTPGILNNKKQIEYGYGFGINNSKIYKKRVTHRGSWPGYETYITRFIDDDILIVILINRQELNVKFPDKLIREYLYNQPVVLPIDRKFINIEKHKTENLEGTYTKKGIELKVKIIGNYLTLNVNNNYLIDLYAENETLFFNSKMNLEVKFILNKKGECKKIIASLRGDKMKFKRVIK
jgi:CubicO group peptidase (beta-lactamase class C family)